MNYSYGDISSLIEKISEGDSVAFEKIYKLYFRKCYSIALYFVKSGTAAEDIISEVFLSLWQRRFTLKEIKNWESFLFISVRNHSLTYLSKQKQMRFIPYDPMSITIQCEDLSPTDVLLKNEFEHILQQALDELPEKSRLIYYMIREEKLSYKQISEALNISERTVNSHMTTAVKKLTQSLKNYFGKTGKSD